MKTVYSMNDGWKFKKAAEIHFDMGGDNDFDMFSGYTKTGAMVGPASDSFYDGDWQTLSLPHDWAVTSRLLKAARRAANPAARRGTGSAFRLRQNGKAKEYFCALTALPAGRR